MMIKWVTYFIQPPEYMRFVKVVRVALKNEHAALKKLDLLGTRKKTLSGWRGQVKQFYLRG